MKIKEKKLNNKGRKGIYIYIKDKGKPGRYYKKREGLDITNYVAFYEGGVRYKKAGVTNIDNIDRTKAFRKKLKKYPKIDNFIKKGETSTKESLVKNIDRAKVKRIYKEMLKPLVNDEEILDLLSDESNINKLKHRIEAYITIGNEEKGQSVTFITHGKTITNIISDFKVVKTNLLGGNIIQLKNKGYKVFNVRSVNIKSYDKSVVIKDPSKVSLKLEFRRG